MKRLIVIFALMLLALRGTAQVYGPPQHSLSAPDIFVGVNFSGTTNWPPESLDFWGNGSFHHYFPTFDPSLLITNLFQFTIYSPTAPQAAWLLKQETNGSFTTITNLIISGGPDEYYSWQMWDLNTNDVYALLTGQWYAAVDFGDSNYVSKLMLLGWQGPFIGFPLERGVHNFFGYNVISGNNRTAKVIFDGSNCTDYLYLPVECRWTMQPVGSPVPFTVTNLMTTNTFDIGWHTATIQVADSVVTGASWDFQFDVITAADAVQMMIYETPHDNLSARNWKISIKLLTIIQEEFKHGQMAEGCAHLRAYKQFVSRSQMNINSKNYLLTSAQDIIDAVKDP